MRLIASIFLPAMLMVFSGAAISEQAETEAAEATDTTASEVCDMPAAPIIPDGNVASEDELIAAQKAMKMYQESLGTYRECLDGLQSAVDLEAEDGEAKAALILADYNASVDSEAKIAEEFNVAVRAFKTRQQ